MSGSTVVTSSAVPVHNVDHYSAHFVVASSPGTTAYVTGTFKLQGSNQIVRGTPQRPLEAVTNWFDITGASQAIVASGSANQVYFNVADACYMWVRSVYTNTAGSGSFVGWAAGKMPS